MKAYSPLWKRKLPLPLWKSGLDFVNGTQRSSLVHLVNRILDLSVLSTSEETAPHNFIE